MKVLIGILSVLILSLLVAGWNIKQLRAEIGEKSIKISKLNDDKAGLDLLVNQLVDVVEQNKADSRRKLRAERANREKLAHALKQLETERRDDNALQKQLDTELHPGLIKWLWPSDTEDCGKAGACEGVSVGDLVGANTAAGRGKAKDD